MSSLKLENLEAGSGNPTGQKSHKSKSKSDHGDLDLIHSEEQGEPWLMSYADMMTLLFCFFVIMTSFATFDAADVAKNSKEIANYTSNGEIDREEQQIKDLKDDVASNAELQGIATTKIQEGSMEMIFTTTVLYPTTGGMEAQENFLKNIDVIVGLIKNRSSDYRVIVEAHTDLNDSEQVASGHQMSSWEISSQKAAQVIDRFIHQGFDANQLVAVGYGDSRPVASGHDKRGRVVEENQALNRRVVIKVLQPMRGTKIKKMKMENYFENEEILDE